MLTIVTWKWQPSPGYRSEYTAKTVNVLKAMVDRWYPHPHRVICVTDESEGIDRNVVIVPAWNDFADLRSPHGGRNPACYRRLRMFHPDIASVFGDRFVSLDLDVVLTGDVSSIWNRQEDFVAVGDTNPMPGSHYNGSMMLLRAGSRRQVWDLFNPLTSPRESLRAGSWGSDQGHISHILGPGEARWTTDDGVYSFRNHIRAKPNKLPENAKLVSFHGRLDPWHPEAQKLEWVQRYWTEGVTCAA